MSQKAVDCLAKFGRSIPCIFIGCILAWSYYAMMSQVLLNYYKNVVANIPLLVFLIIFYNLISVLFIWAWLKTVFTSPGTINNDFRLSMDEQKRYSSLPTSAERDHFLSSLIEQRNLTVYTRQEAGSNSSVTSGNLIRYCRKTNAIKPDRSHYDSMTRRIVLKMDHYCPWVANCIGYGNYKFFVLFLFYAVCYCLSITGIGAAPFVKVWSDSGQISDKEREYLDRSGFKIQTILVFLVASVFSISILCLFSFHLYLVSKNRTTIECYGPPIIRNLGGQKKAFHQGCMENWRQVFGDSLWIAILPIPYDHPDLDNGHRFPLNSLLRTNSGIELV